VTSSLKTESYFSNSMMFSVAVASLGVSNIHILEPGVKITGYGRYYHNVVSRCMLLPDICAAFVFQQDSAPSHHAKDTVALKRRIKNEWTLDRSESRCSLNVLLASGVSVYVLASALEADISST